MMAVLGQPAEAAIRLPAFRVSLAWSSLAGVVKPGSDRASWSKASATGESSSIHKAPAPSVNGDRLPGVIAEVEEISQFAAGLANADEDVGNPA